MAKGKLEVYVIDAHGIKHKEQPFGCLSYLWCKVMRVHPYIVINFLDRKCISSIATYQGERKKLVWNEKLTFEDVEYTVDQDQDQTYKITLKIIENNRFSQEHIIGETKIYVKDVLSIGVEKGKEELRTQKYRIVSPNLTYIGEMTIYVSFIVNPKTMF